jgi:tetratricopeptide (TPR) repeat protein
MMDSTQDQDRNGSKWNHVKSMMDHIFIICNNLSSPISGKRRNQDADDIRPTKFQKLSAWSKSSLMTSSFSQASSLRVSDDRAVLSSGDNIFKSHGRVYSVGLSLQKLEILLCETSSIYCTNKFLVDSLHFSYSGIASQKNHSPEALERRELQELADALKDILNDALRMPTALVAHIHSNIGLLRQHLREYEASIEAFTKALWLIASMSFPNKLEVGILMHRIGIVRSQMGNKFEAIRLLEKALSVYRCEGLHENHAYIMTAKHDIQEFLSIIHLLPICRNNRYC